jgi:hypothetical protein
LETQTLEERVEHLERQIAAINRVVQIATGADQNLDEDAESLQRLIQELPAMSQTGVCTAARTRFSFSRGRTIEVLRAGLGRFWRVEAGLYNSLLYLPLARGMHSNSEEKEHANAESERKANR